MCFDIGSASQQGTVWTAWTVCEHTVPFWKASEDCLIRQNMPYRLDWSGLSARIARVDFGQRYLCIGLSKNMFLKRQVITMKFCFKFVQGQILPECWAKFSFNFPPKSKLQIGSMSMSFTSMSKKIMSDQTGFIALLWTTYCTFVEGPTCVTASHNISP